MSTCRTAPCYRLYALAGTVPPKPGLLRTTDKSDGKAMNVEVWEMSVESFGSFVAAIPPPMGIGNLELEDGTIVKGFICEPYAIAARGISPTMGVGGSICRPPSGSQYLPYNHCFCK